MEVKIDKFPSHVVFFLNQFPRQGLEQNFLFLVSFIVIYSSLSYICCEKVMFGGVGGAVSGDLYQLNYPIYILQEKKTKGQTHGLLGLYFDFCLFFCICCTYLYLFGPIWTNLDSFGPIWTYLYLLGPICTYLDLFRPT